MSTRDPVGNPWQNPDFWIFVKRYPRSPQQYSEWFDGDNKLKIQAFNAAYDKIDMSKTPGSPIVYRCPTNRTLESIKGQLYSTVSRRLLQLENLGERFLALKRFNFSKQEMYNMARIIVKTGTADPILVVKKAEPRLKGKISRLVSQVCVNQNLCQRIIVGDYLLDEQKNKGFPTATQLDINTPEKTMELYHELKENADKHGYISSSDVQGWEYAVTPELQFLDACRMCYCMQLCDEDMIPFKGKERHFHAVWGNTVAMVYRLVQTNEGELLFPPPGQIASGELATFSKNSFIRAWLANLVSLINSNNPVEFVKSAGDDCLDTNPNLNHIYERLGFKITDYEEQDQYFSFCSTKFTKDGAYQENIAKFIYNMICKGNKMEGEFLVSFNSSFGLHPDRAKYLAIFDEITLAIEARIAETKGGQ